MVRMALAESQDCSWAARGWEAMSFFVCLLYTFKAAAKMVSKFVEEVEEDGTWDIAKSKERVGCLREIKKVAEKGRKTRLTHCQWVTPCIRVRHVQHHDKI
jgi:hypothetical protein